MSGKAMRETLGFLAVVASMASRSKTQPKVESRACSTLARRLGYRFRSTCDVLDLMS